MSIASTSLSRWHDCLVGFITAELDATVAFASVAARCDEERTRARLAQLACKAYQTALRFMTRINVSVATGNELAKKKQQAETALRRISCEDESLGGTGT